MPAKCQVVGEARLARLRDLRRALGLSIRDVVGLSGVSLVSIAHFNTLQGVEGIALARFESCLLGEACRALLAARMARA